MSRKRKLEDKDDNEKNDDIPATKRMKLTNHLSKNIQHSMENKLYHDVEFVVGRDEHCETFSGSRIFYAMHSKVLENMLFGSMQESLLENQVIIPDVSPKAFNYFQLLIYSHSPSLNYDICIDVLYLAQKYLIDFIVKECKDHILLINNLNDFYKILNSFILYPPSTFNNLFEEYLLKCKYLKIKNKKKQHTVNIIKDNKFIKLPIYIIQKIIKSKQVYLSEQSKYIYCKKYCMDMNDECNDDWRNVFKKNFLNLIDFSRIKSDYLLSIIRKDNILTNEQLLTIWEIKTKRDKPGFKIEELLLSYDECIQLMPFDVVDVRCCNGEIVQGTINNIGDDDICISYSKNIQEFVSFDDQRLMINGSISSRNNIIKPCMQNLKINKCIFINMLYLPSKQASIDISNKWIQCKIIGFSKQNKQIKVRSIDDKMDGDYYFHPDSKDEVACSLECEYCHFINQEM